MGINAAGLDVSGSKNPNWKGGTLDKTCAVCGKPYKVKRVHSKSRYCSLQCVGVSQRGKKVRRNAGSRMTSKECEECGKEFEIPQSHVDRRPCCSMQCSYVRRSRIMAAEKNPNWAGGLSRMPYPWNFNAISKKVIERDAGICQNPSCAGTDGRMTTHHINYDKQDCREINLIALCSACNSKANFGRDEWQRMYEAMMKIKVASEMYPFRFIAVKAKPKRDGGGWDVELFD